MIRRIALAFVFLGMLATLIGTLSVPQIEERETPRHGQPALLTTLEGGREASSPDDPIRLWRDVDQALAPDPIPLAPVDSPVPLALSSRFHPTGSPARAEQRSGPWTTDHLLADPTHMNDQHVAVVCNPATGHYFAVFEAVDLGGTDRDIHLAWSNDGGTTWQQLELHPSSLDEFHPDIAIDTAGYLHVVWAREDGALVRARSAGPEDVQNWALVRVFEVGEPVAVPSIAVSGSGDFARVFIACCWYTVNWNWYQYEYTLLWLYSTNGSQTVAYDYLQPDGYQDLWPDVALSGSTVSMVNGEQDPGSGRIRILAAADGLSGTFADYIDLTQASPMSHGFPTVAADGQNIYLAWQLDWDDGMGNVDGDVMYAFSWDGLATAYGPYELQATLSESVGPVIAARDGVVGCWWLEAEVGGDAFYLASRQAPLDGHPDYWGRTEYVTDVPMVVPQFRAAAGALGPDGFLAVWTDRRDYATEGYNVYVCDRGLTADLSPYTPDQWESPLVVNLQPGVREDGPLADGSTAYVSLAIVNLGLADAAGPVETELWLDGTRLDSWVLADGLPQATFSVVEDWPLELSAGAHTLTLTIDPRNVVPESDESDNTLTKDLWVATGEPNLVFSPSNLLFYADAPVPAPLATRTVETPVFDTRLAQTLDAAGRHDRLRVVVVPTERPDPVVLATMGRRAAINALKEHSASVRRNLASAARTDLRALWLTAELVGELTPDEIANLAANRAVASIWLDDQQSRLLGGPERPVLLGVPMADASRAPWPLENLGVPVAWAQGFDGSGILVGHTDSGVAWDHPDLVGHLWDGGSEYPHHGYDFLDDDHDPYDPGDGDFWHGTHTAGLIVSSSYGAAPGARLVVARCVPGYYEDMVEALQFCVDQSCRVISSSAGWTDPGDPLRSANRNNAEILLALGTVWIVAAGNGDNAGGHVAIPRDISSPGDCPDPWFGIGGHSAVISVGAVTQSGGVWSSSSRGPTGWDVTSDAGHDDYPYPPGLVKPDVVAPGVDIMSTVGHGGYASYSGTSMATPLVAGCAAVLLQANPTLTPSQLAEALESSSVDLGVAGRDNESGAGLVDLPAALAILPSSHAAFVQVHNTGAVPLVIDSITASAAWLSVTPATGLVAAGDSLRLAVAWDASSLGEGAYSGSVVVASNDPGGLAHLPVILRVGEATSADALPATAHRLVCYPNPFNPRTTLRFDLSRADRVDLALFDARGRRVRRLLWNDLPPGRHEVLWDGCDGAGRPCAAGVYLARLRAEGTERTGRLMLVR